MSIQGDLNEEEMQDIKHLMQNLNKIAKSFFQGDTENALKKALDIGDMGSLNQMSASFSYSEQIATTQTVSTYNQFPNLTGETLTGLSDLKKMLEEEFIEDLKFADLLRARWQQLREAFEQEKENIRVAGIDEVGSIKDSDISAAEQMLERVKDTVEKQPQLSPFMVPVAKQAIKDAAELVSQKEAKHVQPEKLHNDFVKKWHDWILS